LETGFLVTKALAALMKKEIIVKNGRYMIQDIVFKKWLQKALPLRSNATSIRGSRFKPT
jgi:hypothetical protein